ncbi:DUF1684 domain-containing protein [Catellatospora tritici]|uniref:DUF1684 domain-containing protein n=1 Tax=Catellatospora tritici TaxID=2851566 RepID=UPI001C2D1B76|nr:DUF1684 domain-containing protein [Catellatospora tritici]MBV1855581.1 DUF1684 domain-containing protein [Catellatospora tritici]
MTETTTQHDVEQWRLWRTEREESLREPHGWLSPVALHWLTDQPTGFDDLPGSWSADGDGVTLRARAEDGFTADGAPVHGEIRLDRSTPKIVLGDRQVEVMGHNIGWAVRVRDPRSPALTGFTGVPTRDYDPRWAVPGVYEPYDEPRQVTVGAVVAGLIQPASAVGVVRFEVDGVEHRLTAFAGGANLVILFNDATSGDTTFWGSRALVIPVPGPDGRLLVDFNRATNPPAAFTDHATCPVPPTENRLPVAVEAGELKPRR